MKPAGLRHIRAVSTAPRFGGLPSALQAMLADASAAMPSLPAISSEMIDAAPDFHFHSLRHELSAHYLALHPASGGNAGRSRLEAGVLSDFEAARDGSDTLCPKQFLAQLHALNLSLTDGKGGWREGSVKLADDKAGNQIYFPPVSAVPRQVERLRLLLAGPSEAPPLFTAAVAYLLLLNCHPFTDGNGRTARVLFNHVLHRGGMPGHVYLPLHEIARRSHGGYEIALRLAELRGDWAPFLRWLLKLLACYRVIGKAALPSGQS